MRELTLEDYYRLRRILDSSVCTTCITEPQNFPYEKIFRLQPEVTFPTMEKIEMEGFSIGYSINELVVWSKE